MAFSAEQSSPVAYVTDTCCICDEEFSSDGELAGHLIEHGNDDEFRNCLNENSNARNNLPSTPSRVFPEFTSTTFVKDDIGFRKNLNKPSASPEVWEIVSDDSDGESSKTPNKSNKSNQKQSSSFRLISSPSPHKPAPIPASGPPYKCHHCALVASDINSYREHLQTHEKSRPYSCDICNKTFAYKGTLRQHLHLHIGEKLHECKTCHKKFTLKSVLRKHEETHETQTTNGPQTNNK